MVQHFSTWGLNSIKKKGIIILPCPCNNTSVSSPKNQNCFFINNGKQNENLILKMCRLDTSSSSHRYDKQPLRWQWQCTFSNKIKNLRTFFSKEWESMTSVLQKQVEIRLIKHFVGWAILLLQRHTSIHSVSRQKNKITGTLYSGNLKFWAK